MRYSIDGGILEDIAKSIRSGKGTTDLINPTEFKDEIYAFLNTSRGVIDRSASHIDIPYGTTQIGKGAFMYYEAFETITIPDTVTLISASAFNSATKFKSIFIPKSVTEIGSNAFAWCFGCKEFDFSSYERVEEIPKLGSDAFTKVFDMQTEKGKILVPGDLLNHWAAAPNWSEYMNYIIAVCTIYVCLQKVKVVEGQTWQEWIDSKRNTVGATVHDGIVYVNEKPLYCDYGGYTDTYADDYLVEATSAVDTARPCFNSTTYVAFKLCGKWTYGLLGQTLEQWMESPFNKLGAFIQTDAVEYWVEFPDGTQGLYKNTRGEITDIPLYDGAIYL